MCRRPLCLVALLFVLWMLCTQKLFWEKGFGVAGTEGTGGYQAIPLPDICPGQVIRVRGEIYRQEKKNTNQIYLKNNSILSGTNQGSYDSNIIIFSEKEESYQIGNILEVTGVWKEPEAASNPGQFDMKKWYHAQGVGFTMSRCQIRLLDKKRDVLRQTMAEIRGRLSESFYQIGEEKEASLMCAMLLGDKNGLSEEVKELYQQGGISHVLAISGLHVSLLGMLLFGAVRRLGVPFAGAGLISGGFLGLYCLMTGMSVSTARAFLMFLVYLGAQACGRTYDLKSSLSLAMVLLLCKNPELLFQGGFQLSVLAVAGLAYLYPVLKKRIRIKNKFADSLLVSLSVQLAIFPCMLYHFYEFSAAGIFLNLLLLPSMSVLLLAGLLGGVVGLFSLPAGVFVFAPCHYILGYMEFLCAASLRIPGVRQIWGRPGAGSILLYYGILLSLLFALERGESGRGKLALWGGLLAFGAAGLPACREQGMEMTFLDVGQGDGIFWRTEDGVSCLCDGGSSSVKQVGKYRLLPFLKCRGVRRLDFLFLTHMDEDHINGVWELLEGDTGISVGCLALPDIEGEDENYQRILQSAGQSGISVVKFHDGMEMHGEGWSLECLGPEEGADGSDKNAASLVLALEYGSFRALLTGDVEGEGEQRLIKSGDVKEISVLKVAHHGSKNSTPEEFLDMACPAAAVISCGKDNSYGHPAPELVERLEDIGAVVYTTMEQGAVTVTTDGERFSVKGYTP